MIKVYFEWGLNAELVATFTDEDLYVACTPALEAEAFRVGAIVTESVDEED